MSSSIPNQPIDRNSYIPFYIQVIDSLTDYIESNKFPPGTQLPGEADLCETYDVSRTVIRQALQELDYKGLIFREKGRGTFVAKPKIHEGLFQELTGFYQDMVAKGHRPRSDVLKQEQVSASQKVASYLCLEPGALVIQIDRLRYVNHEPIVLVTTYLPYDICPALLQVDLTDQSLYAYLESEHGLFIASGKRFLEAVVANQLEAELLKVDEGSPLILLNSVSYLKDGTPIEYFHALHRGDRSRFETELVRVQEPGELAKKILDVNNS
ncbi:MAG: GntR family transcriptional regulator [Anaerolineales bacterium]|nr:GntR family transcriptional regulator [Anaerolineales bacterium]